MEEMPGVILEHNGQPLTIPRVAFAHIAQGDYAAAAFDALPENQRTHDEKAANALNVFYQEYRRLQDMGFNALLRAGIRQGVKFAFRPEFPGDPKTVARYAQQIQTIEFQIPKYQSKLPHQNALGHELGHMMLDGRNKSFDVPKNFIEDSEFGRMWFNYLKQVEFLYDNRWEDEGVHQNASFGTEYGRQVMAELDRVKGRYPAGINNETWTGEMLCRILEYVADNPQGINALPRQSVDRAGVECIMLMAEAYANGNEHAHEKIARAVAGFDLYPAVKKAHENCLRSQEAITARRTFSNADFADHRKAVAELTHVFGQDGMSMLARARRAAGENHPEEERQQKTNRAVLRTLAVLAEIRDAQEEGRRMYVFREQRGMSL